MTLEIDSDSPIHCALMTLEILELIFVHAYDGLVRDYTRYALVCRLWSSSATDMIWRRCHDPAAFFQKLAPMTKVHHQDHGECYAFTRPLRDDDWVQYRSYASRLRLFQTITTELHPDAWREIGRTRPGEGPIFPNLRRLIWDNCMGVSFTLMFMHDFLDSFHTSLTTADHPNANSQSLSTTFDSLARLAPNLTKIGINEDAYVPDAPNALHSLFVNLRKLRRVLLSPTLLTNDVIESLSSLEHLSSLYCADRSRVERNDEGLQIVRLPPLDFSLPPGSFPSLRQLDIFQPLRNVIPFIGQRFFPASLSSIIVESPIPEPATRIHRYSSFLVRRFPSLRVLGLRLPPVPNIMQPDPQRILDNDQIITFNTLKPILTLSNLTDLYITNGAALEMSPAELEDLLSHLPLLEGLALVDSPTHAYNPTFTFEILIPIARHCPRLYSLSLFFDATAYCPLLDPNHPYFNRSRLTPFQSLGRFDGGLSPITKDIAPRVALYLAQILPSTCEMYRSRQWNTGWDDIGDGALDVQSAIANLDYAWRSVSKAFRSIKSSDKWGRAD